MYYKYDNIVLKEKIEELRKIRWRQYKEGQGKCGKNYFFCKTQETLAEELGLESQTISNWETGTNIPSLDNIINLCNKLDCSIDYLLGAGNLREMHYTYKKDILVKQIQTLRNKRWRQYKEGQGKCGEKYSYCKTLETLTKELGLKPQTISKWKTGTNIPSLDNIISLCNKLNCSIDYLLGADNLLEKYRTYDKYMLAERIQTLRKKRWNQYQEEPGKYGKDYSYCKTQETLAEELGLERRTISGWETGTNIPSLDNIIILCNKLDCNIDYLLGADDLLEISPITKVSHYSGISPDIIRFGLKNNDYLDCLNFFMHPDNCSALFNNIILSAWKSYNANQELEELKEPLKNIILKTFEKYSAVTPINKYDKESYKQFLIYALPEEQLIFTTKEKDKRLNIKSCLNLKRYAELDLSKESEHRYDDFICYLVDYTYKPLMNKTVLELQKHKLANAFISLFDKYLSYVNE